MKDKVQTPNLSEAAMKSVWDAAVSTSTDSQQTKAYARLMRRVLFWRHLLVWAGAAAVILLVAALAFRPHEVVEQPVPVQMLQCYVPYGTIKTVYLPDGTEVILNAGSMLIYPESFCGDSREVYLDGEAAFDVTRNPSCPFVVKSADFDVKVLGTVFNITSYPGSKTSSVVLREGSVKIISPAKEIVLDEDQMARYSRENGSFRVEGVRAEDYTLWCNGQVCFERASIEDIISTVERRFNVKVLCNRSDKYSKACITARFDNFETLDDLLSILSRLIPGMKYKIEDGTAWLY